MIASASNLQETMDLIEEQHKLMSKVIQIAVESLAFIAAGSLIISPKHEAIDALENIRNIMGDKI